MQNAQLLPEHTAYQCVMQVAYIKKVEKLESPRRQRRKMQLVSLIAEYGGASQVARESGTPKSHLSAIVAGRRGVGDELAKKLEGIYAKPEGWFDAVNLADGRQHTAQSPALTHAHASTAQPVSPGLGIEAVATALLLLNESEREVMAGKLAALARAPDSPTLKKSISESLVRSPPLPRAPQ